MKKKCIKPVDIYVGGRLRLIRNSQNLTQNELAKALKISVRHLRKMEAGIKRIPPKNMQKLAQIFSVEVSFFFEGINDTTIQAFSQKNQSKTNI